MPVRTPRLTDFRTSLVQTVRDARAPRVQDRSGTWVDHGRRARAGLRPRLRRRGRLESRHLHVLIPRIGSPLESRSRGLCVPPLRGRWRKGDYLHGTGGGRLPGGLVATKLDVKVNGSVVESIDESERHGAHSP